MRTTTTQAIPFPEPGDHTRTWEYWQGMAERLDTLLSNGFNMAANAPRPLPYATFTTKAHLNVSNNIFAVANLTFPSGRFTHPPAVVASCNNWSAWFVATPQAVTTSGFQLYVRYTQMTNLTTAIDVSILAVQMRSTGDG